VADEADQNARRKLTEADIENAALAGALEGARAGVTCFGDIGRFGVAGFKR
jgi:rRNA maturation endonuclease Nob1